MKDGWETDDLPSWDNSALERPPPPSNTDEALALEFVKSHENSLRYVASKGKWLHWTGTFWRTDDTLLAFDRVRWLCREAASRANKASVAKSLASAKTVAAVERLAKSDRKMAATLDQWDAYPDILNTTGENR